MAALKACSEINPEARRQARAAQLWLDTVAQSLPEINGRDYHAGWSECELATRERAMLIRYLAERSKAVRAELVNR
jgi:hypothetical protein